VAGEISISAGQQFSISAKTVVSRQFSVRAKESVSTGAKVPPQAQSLGLPFRKKACSKQALE
jgi:hypothetical protein